MPTKSSKNSKSPKDSNSEVNKTLLGQILVELGYITIYQLDEALHIQKEETKPGEDQKPLGQIVLELGYCGPNQLIRAIQVQVDYRRAQEKELKSQE